MRAAGRTRHGSAHAEVDYDRADTDVFAAVRDVSADGTPTGEAATNRIAPVVIQRSRNRPRRAAPDRDLPAGPVWPGRQHHEPQHPGAVLLVAAMNSRRLRQRVGVVAHRQAQRGEASAVPVGGGVIEPARPAAQLGGEHQSTDTAAPCRQR